MIVDMTLGANHVSEYMKKNGIEGNIAILGEDEARTSVSAARTVGCPVSQIAKSIVLVGDKPFIVILSGDKKVDLTKASSLIGHDVRLADAETVLEETGFRIGGVPPFGHRKQLRVFIDHSLERFKEVYASAGSPDALLRIRMDILKKATGAEIVEVSS